MDLGKRWGHTGKEILPAGKNDFGVYYDVEYNRSSFHFKFKDARGRKVIWEDDSLDRYFHLQLGGEIWTMADRHNVYNVLPARPRGHVRDYYARIKDLVYKENFYLPDTDVSGLSMTSMLGANILRGRQHSLSVSFTPGRPGLPCR